MYRAALRTLDVVGVGKLPMALLDYIHYSWVADGERAESALGFIPFHHVRDAAAALRRS
jgi:UDP-glucose 4-epimerase